MNHSAPSSGRLAFRHAGANDCVLLAELNHQLIQDEAHRNPMTLAELEQRMRGWLGGEYAAVIFQIDCKAVAYALFRESESEIYLRQFFVVREQRRQGIGRRAVEILRTEIWPRDKRLTVEVLTKNDAGIAFWRSCGYRDYCLTLEIAPPKF